MVAVEGKVLGHLFRRGVEAAQSHLYGVSPEYVQQLQQDAQLYDQAGPEMEMDPMEFLPLLITFVIALIVIASIRYTVGDVIATLSMIETPQAALVIEDKPPAYADEPDAPLEKELLPSEAQADVEVLLVHTKPITAKITTSLKHLQRTGGYKARWRGAGLSVFYHLLHSLISQLLLAFFGIGFVGTLATHVIVTLALARLHMAWTHSIISFPSQKPWYRRMVPRQQARAILLPSLFLAVAQHATLMYPLMVAYLVGIPDLQTEHIMKAANHQDCAKMALMSLRFLAVPLTALVLALFALLPATVTLARVEAALLPEGEQTIVPFDRDAVIGGIDLTSCGASRAVFAQALKSFDRTSRSRLIKLYVKMALMQIAVGVTAVHIMVAELYFLGAERLAIFFTSASAQVKLMLIDAAQD